MNSSVKTKLGLGVLLVGLTALTLNYVMKQVRLLVNTKFDFDGVTLSKLSIYNISITLWWKVRNYSDFTFTIENQVYDIFINDEFIKKVGMSDSIDILSKGDSRIPTYVSIDTSELLDVGLKNIQDLIVKENRKNIKLKVVGYFTIKASIFSFKKIPFEFEKTLDSIMN